MHTRRTLTRASFSAAMLISMAAIWSLFAPVQFGGQASYVIIAGASMEPALHTGDLVIARQASDYSVGEVVTYAHPQVGPVIHRIIERRGQAFILQGDNNDWIDSYEPTPSDILGKSWITLPGAANFINQVRSPVGLTLLSLAVGFMVLATASREATRPKGRSHQVKPEQKTTAGSSMANLQEGWLFVLATLLLGGILLGFFAFSNPMLETIQADIPYEHTGRFSYQATAGDQVYDQGRIETGDAIFHRLVSSFDTTFDYALNTMREADLAGTYRVVLELSEPNGWRRRITLVPTTEFTGPAFSTTAAVDVKHLLELIDQLEESTGFNRGAFDIRILPMVYFNAEIAGHQITDRFVPALHFKLDEHQLYLDGVNPFEATNDPLAPSEARMIANFRQIPNTLNIMGLAVEVSAARWIAGVSVGLALAGLGYALYPTVLNWRKGEAQRIRMRFSEVILEVDKLPTHKAAETIDVKGIDELLKLATSSGEIILHLAKGGKNTYLLRLEGIAYRFVLVDSEDEQK